MAWAVRLAYRVGNWLCRFASSRGGGTGSWGDAVARVGEAPLSDQLRLALDTAGIVAVTDARGRITYVNDNFCAISGYSREELIGANHRILNSGHHDKAFFKAMYATIARGKPWRGEICNRAKDGSLYWVDTTIVPVVDHRGRPTNYLALRIDVTDRVRFAERSTFLAKTLECASEPILVVDPVTLRFEYVNDAAVRHTGYSRDELLRMGPPDLKMDLDERTIRAYLDATKDDLECPLRFVTTHRTKGGGRVPVEVSTQYVPELGGSGRFVQVVRDVTVTQDAAKRIAESEERLSLTLKATGTGIWDWDVPSGLVKTNGHWHTMLGDTSRPEAMKIERFEQLMHPEDRERVFASVNEAFTRKSGLYAAEFRMRHADGRWVWVRSAGRVMSRGPDGSPLRMLGTHVDIDEQRRAAEQLIARERLLEQAGRMARFGGWEYDVVTGEVVWSASLREILEVDEAFVPDYEHAVGMYKPWARKRVAEVIERAIEAHEPFEVELEITTAKGREIWVRVAGEAEVVEGQCVRLSGALQDITEERRAKDAMERVSAMLSQTSRLAGVGGWELDFVTRAVTWSPEARLVLGIRDADRPGLESVFGGEASEDGAELASAVENCLRLGRAFDLEVRLRAERDALRWIRIIGAPRGGRGVVDGVTGAIQDITEQKRLQFRMRDATRAAEAASRAKSDFLANMSHEIRTPMTAILGFADVLAENESSEERRGEAVETIRRNGFHLMDVINDVLDMSKIEAGKMEMERIATAPLDVVRGVCELLRVRAEERGLSLTAEIDGEVPVRIASDPTRLRQIVLNLVGNAVKFTERGSVRVVVGFEGSRVSGRLRISVIDTGIGMSEEQCGRVFEAFSQADGSMTRRFGGTGLGLRISASLAELLGGSIGVSSEPGVGSTFTVTVAAGDCSKVPFASEFLPGDSACGVESRDSATAGSSGKPLEGRRVLVAEDGVDNQRLIGLFLRKAGAAFVMVDDGLAAVEAAEGAVAEGAAFDVILMDMQMPVMDGYTATRRLRTHGYTGRIVALTAHAMVGDREKCMLAGCDGYTTKPIQRAELIRACLGGDAAAGTAGAAAA